MDLLDRLLGHDAWTTRQLLLLCRDLTDEQLDHDFDIGHRTVRTTFRHIIRNVEGWSDLMAGRPIDNDQRSPGTSISELIARLDLAAADLAKVARAVAQRDGWDEKWLDKRSEPPKEFTYGGSIAHVITHSMHHRAQVLYLLRQLGLKDLPEGDVLSWEHQAGAAPAQARQSQS
ncbi:MAG TPA: DinB family protein [Planctomycetaceae bacterium]|jgi:uncharacterized damage-inducible protein DinB|nr:DinB family protein [Planctomycetaceae bacterium]